MGLTLLFGLLLFLLFNLCLGLGHEPLFDSNDNSSVINPCPEYGPLEHASLKLIDTSSVLGLQTLHVECNEGYELIGPPKILCKNGDWEETDVKPQCVDSSCRTPPYITNGALEIDGSKDYRNMYKQGTNAIYSCSIGYDIKPTPSRDSLGIVRKCEKGIWTGPFASCVLQETPTGCSKPNDIANGHFVPGNFGDSNEYSVGQRVHYSCNSGYVLDSYAVQQCLEDGTWSPRLQPTCSPITTSGE